VFYILFSVQRFVSGAIQIHVVIMWLWWYIHTQLSRKHKWSCNSHIIRIELSCRSCLSICNETIPD